MSYTNFEKALCLIEKHEKLINFKSAITADNIQKIENAWGIKFPLSYKVFLEKFGILHFGGSTIEGISAYYLQTNGIDEGIKKLHEERVILKLPKKYVVVYNLGNGFEYALDTSQMNKEGECAVKGSYAFHYQEAATEDSFEDFGDFLLNQVQFEIKNADEEEWLEEAQK